MIIYSTFLIIIKNPYSINWTKEFNGISSSFLQKKIAYLLYV